LVTVRSFAWDAAGQQRWQIPLRIKHANDLDWVEAAVDD